MTIRYWVLVLLAVAGASAHAQGDRRFCDGKTDGWYTHPSCHYLYKCQAGYTYEVPMAVDRIISSSCDLPPGGEPLSGNFCATKNSGLYLGAGCGTYTLCTDGKAMKHTVPKNTSVCEL